MKTLKSIAALSVIAGGMMFAGMSNSADAGCYGGYCAPTYGYNYYRPVIATYPRVNLSCDAYGCHYFVDSYGIRHNCFATSINGRYFYNHLGRRHFVLGY